ncbi:MAG: P27 family phage terminase small subunit [Thermodesulfobacteriota bacterium]
MALKKPKNIAVPAPKHLSKAAKELWADLVEDYDFESHQFELLRLLCESLDRLEACRKQLKKDGCFLKNRFGETKPHPALREEREHKVLFARLARELNLDLEIPDSPRKPRRY